MTLTRRLYELDEVVASFMLSLRRCKEEESLFWLEELEISAEDEYAIKALFNIWFLRAGLVFWPFWLSWKTYKDSLDGRYALVKAWCKNKNCDSTLWRSYCLGFATDKAWDTSLTRKPALEWWAKGSNSSLDCAEFWFDALNVKCKSLDLEITPIDLPYEIENIRISRKFSVNSAAHLGFTRRGLSWNSKHILHDISLYSLLGSPIWAGLLDEYVSSDNEWLGDTEMEAFYDKFFGKSDYPDEWSAVDREKSHGFPPSKRNECPFMQWWTLWVPAEHKYIYGRAQVWLMEWIRSKTVKNVFEDLEGMKINKNRSYDLCKDKLIIYTTVD